MKDVAVQLELVSTEVPFNYNELTRENLSLRETTDSRAW
jgi:hypothetical protein